MPSQYLKFSQTRKNSQLLAIIDDKVNAQDSYQKTRTIHGRDF